MSLRIASFAPTYDTKGKHDAAEFRREQRKFCVCHGINARAYLFDNSKPMQERSAYVREALAYYQELDAVAMFMHGTKSSLQCGLIGLDGAQQLAASLARFSSLSTVILYCCDTARDGDKDRDDDTKPGPGGDGGFADMLRDELSQTFSRNVTIFGHAVTAHTTRAKFCRRFDAATGHGGEWVVEPHSEQWRAWCRALDSSPDFRFKFPFYSQAELDHALLAYRKDD